MHLLKAVLPQDCMALAWRVIHTMNVCETPSIQHILNLSVSIQSTYVTPPWTPDRKWWEIHGQCKSNHWENNFQVIDLCYWIEVSINRPFSYEYWVEVCLPWNQVETSGGISTLSYWHCIICFIIHENLAPVFPEKTMSFVTTLYQNRASPLDQTCLVGSSLDHSLPCTCHMSTTDREENSNGIHNVQPVQLLHLNDSRRHS